ncbi:MAG: DinB family protein [Panacagrimonas sp.]
MSRCPQFRLQAQYNRWFNRKVYEAAGRLDPAAIAQDRGAFFGSILRTLNHVMVGDLIWLRRFAAVHPSRPPVVPTGPDGWPEPERLNHVLYADFDELRRKRDALDALFETWVGTLTEADLDVDLEYRNTQGVPARRSFVLLLVHLFNHQTHHRGQVTTLLTQAGQDVGATDMLNLIPNALAPA